MANSLKKVNENTEGRFFVDTTCINCDACRKIAPEHFFNTGKYSAVGLQPNLDRKEDVIKVTQALLSCPTGSIGGANKEEIALASEQLPIELYSNVFFNGYNSVKSFGADSYFVKGAKHNWLIDSPRFNSHLVKKFEQWGGVDYIFLSHRDDVADADKYAAKFKAKRIIHYWDREAQPDAEIIIKEEEALPSFPDFKLLYAPGHTRGHMLALYKDEVLFTGDHLAYLNSLGGIGAFKDFCWYDWEVQLDSLQQLQGLSQIKAVFPGHGRPAFFKPGAFSKALETYLKTYLKTV